MKNRDDFQEYIEAFLKQNSYLNLISKNDEKFLWEKHIFDSLAIEKFFEKYFIAAKQLRNQAAKSKEEDRKVGRLEGRLFNESGVSENLTKQQIDNSLSSYPPTLLPSENKDFYAQTLDYIHTHKTADLFKLALRSGAIIAGASEEQLEEITEFGQTMGVAFQIADDILDVTSTFEEMGKTLGKDEQEGKLTYVSLYGLDKAKEDLNKMIDKCFEILDKNNLKSEIFEKILNKMRIS